MVQVISRQNEEQPSFLQSLLGGLIGGISPAVEKYQGLQKEAKQRKSTAKLFGEEIANLSPELQKAAIPELLRTQGKENLFTKKQDFMKSLLGQKEDDSPSSLNKTENINENAAPQGKFSKISDEDIVQASLIDPVFGKSLRDAKDAEVKSIEGNKKEDRRKFEADRDFHSKRSDPIINAAETVVKNSPINRALIDQQRRDIASGNTSGLLPFLVDKLGLEAYRNPESARFRTASKQRFVESLHDLGGAGARPNQFIEAQLVSSQPSLGRSEEANLGVLDLEEFVEDMKLQRSKYELDLAEQDREKFGYVKDDVARRADKLMKDFTEQRQDEMAYDIRKRHEDAINDEELTRELITKGVGPDTPLTLRMARILMIKNNDDEKKATAEAKRLGFKIPSEKTYLRGSK